MTEHLNDAPDIGVDEAHGHAVAHCAHGARVLGLDAQGHDKRHDHEPPHPPSQTHFQGSFTTSTHVVSRPTTVTRSDTICLTRTPPAAWPGRRASGPSEPGMPSMSAEGSPPPSHTMPASASVGRGCTWIAACDSRSGS